MGEQTLDRRQVLRGAGVAAGGIAVTGLGFAAPAAASDDHDDDHDDHDDDLEGSWWVTRQDEGSTTEVATILSFADGDVIISHDISPAGPPFTGTWKERGEHGFRATFWTGFPGETGPESVGPTARVRVSGRHEHGKISGTYWFTIFAPSSDEEVDSGTGTFWGIPIEA